MAGQKWNGMHGILSAAMPDSLTVTGDTKQWLTFTCKVLYSSGTVLLFSKLQEML